MSGANNNHLTNFIRATRRHKQSAAINYNAFKIIPALPESQPMSTTLIEFPTEILEAARLSPDELKAELAASLYKQGRLNPEQARQLAGTSPRLEYLFFKHGQAGKLEMDEFISWAAHDLKSPLNAVIGFTKVVLKGIDGPVNETQVIDLTSAHVNGQRMLTLTNNLIDMARLSNGDIKIEKSACDLAAVLGEAISRWQNQNPNKALISEIAFGPVQVEADRARLRQVINGLLTFAANHVADGGQVRLRAQQLEAGFQIEIESSGEKARDKQELDLAMIGVIARGLLHLHDGELWIDPETSTGLALRFSLPGK